MILLCHYIIAPDPPSVNIDISGNSTAGQLYTLTCNVELMQNLRVHPVIEWVGPTRNGDKQCNTGRCDSD